MQSFESGTLLIVDDERSVRRALKRLMRGEGYEIRSAENAATASQILAETSIDVILCDQDMPGQSGTEFLTQAAAQYPHQRRIMLSGRFRSDDVAAAMDSGAIHKFMMKPWDDYILKADVRESFRQLMADIRNQERFDQLGVTETRCAATTASSDTDQTSWKTFEENRKLSRELHEAASNGTLSLQYQPQIDLNTNAVSGLEALLRWDSSLGPIRPDRFIALAERNGSISKLTRWVISEVCYRAAGWRGLWPNAQIGLNVSPYDLRGRALLEQLSTAIKENAIPAQLIQIEITESDVLDVDGSTHTILEAIAAMGFSLVIDDFGAGATSVSYLASLPFSGVKIDRVLTKQVETEKGLHVVRRILALCRDLELKTTVEGVETEEQLQIVRELGADVVQGYFYSPPRKLQNICSWIESGATGIPA